MSHSQDVYEHSYLPRLIRADLLALHFGDAGTTENSQQLFSLLTTACLRRDPDAPVTISKEDSEALMARPHMKRLLADYVDAKAKYGRHGAKTEHLRSQFRYHKARDSAALLEEKRNEYFAAAGRRGALGEPTTVSESAARDSGLSTRMQKDMNGLGTELISSFLHRAELGSGRRAAYFSELLCEYIAHRFMNMESLMSLMIAELPGEHKPHARPVVSKGQVWCLFGCGTFDRRQSLTLHVKALHGNSFTTPFKCPECWRIGAADRLIKGVEEFCDHAERVHGKLRAPLRSMNGLRCETQTLRRYKKEAKVLCLLCQAPYSQGHGHSLHFNLRHRRNDFDEPFQCPTCRRHGAEGEEVVWIDGVDAWLRHTEEVHNVDGQRGHHASTKTLPRLRHEPTVSSSPSIGLRI